MGNPTCYSTYFLPCSFFAVSKLENTIENNCRIVWILYVLFHRVAKASPKKGRLKINLQEKHGNRESPLCAAFRVEHTIFIFLPEQIYIYIYISLEGRYQGRLAKPFYYNDPYHPTMCI